MQDSVGTRAGEIYDYLKKNGESTLKDLKEGVKDSKSSTEDLITNLAIGWLLREDNLNMTLVPKGKSYTSTISLKN